MLLCCDFSLLLLVSGCVFEVADFLLEHFRKQLVLLGIFLDLEGGLLSVVLQFDSGLFILFEMGLALL
jgi:hypothetical protein